MDKKRSFQRPLFLCHELPVGKKLQKDKVLGKESKTADEEMALEEKIGSQSPELNNFCQ